MKNYKKILLTLTIACAGGSLMAWRGGYWGGGWGGPGYWGPGWGYYGYGDGYGAAVAGGAIAGLTTAAIVSSANQQPRTPEESERLDKADQRKHLNKQINDTQKEKTKKTKRIEHINKSTKKRPLRDEEKQEIADIRKDIERLEENLRDLQSQLGSV